MILISLLILLLSITIGFNITNKLKLQLLGETKWAWVISLGLILSGIIFFISYYFLGVENGTYCGIALLGIITIFSAEPGDYKKPAKLLQLNLSNLVKHKYFIGIFLLLGLMLFNLFDTHIIQSKSDGLYTGESTYGDLPFHLTTISQMAFGQVFPPQNPFYSGLPLVYPYLINLYSSTLVYYGFDLRTSIIIPGMLLGLALIALIYEFVLVITKKHFVAVLATLLYFLQGGTGFYYFLKDNFFSAGNILLTLSMPSEMIEYSHLFRENIQWGNFLTRMIVPERSILFGIPAGIMALRILFFRGNDTKISRPEIVISAILLGFMPLLHTHTVLAFIFILPILTLFTFLKNRDLNYLKSILLICAFTILLAAPLIPTFFGHIENTDSFFKFHFGWMTDFSKESFFSFWFKNTYLYIPISLAVLLWPKKFNAEIRILQFASLALFIILNIALFSPYNWDNVKFLFWAGLFWVISSASLIDLVIRQAKTKIIYIPVGIIILTMISSALLSYHREVNLQYMLFSKTDIEAADYFKYKTDQKALVLTETVHNSPASNLAGRQITMGYPGSLWVHGIKYGNRESQVKAVLGGENNSKDIIQMLNINYALIPNFQSELKIDRDFFTQFPLVYENSNFKVYKLYK